MNYRKSPPFSANSNVVVVSDGEPVDIIKGSMFFYLVHHINAGTGKKDWWKFVCTGEKFISIETGEVFSGNYSQKDEHNPEYSYPPDEISFQFNLEGDQGSFYVLNVTWMRGTGYIVNNANSTQKKPILY